MIIKLEYLINSDDDKLNQKKNIQKVISIVKVGCKKKNLVIKDILAKPGTGLMYIYIDNINI